MVSENIGLHYHMLIYKSKLFWNINNRNKPYEYRKNNFKDLISKMLKYDPDERITLNEIKSHDWYKGEVAKASEVKKFM